MNPSANQILQAARNTRMPSMTHGAKLRQALLHGAYDLLLVSSEVDIERLLEYRSQLAAVREMLQ